MNINKYYKEVVDFMNEKNIDTSRALTMEQQLERDLDKVVQSTVQDADILSRAELQSAEIALKKMIKQIPSDPLKSMRGIKAYLEHCLGAGKKKKPKKKEDINKPESKEDIYTQESKNALYGLLFSEQDVNDINVWKKYAQNPKDHPEWVYFVHELRQVLPHATMEDIEGIFKQLMDGVVFELEGRKTPKGKDAPKEKNIYTELREERQVPISFPEELTKEEGKELYAWTRQLIGQKTLNPHYAFAFQKLVNLDKDNLLFLGWGIDSDPNKREASLWTGGILVSEYASKSFRVLEKSRLGKLFDGFLMHPDWKVQYPIWHLLSETFVESEILRQVQLGADSIVLNYNFRADDPNSIGQVIEIPTALSRVALNQPEFENKILVLNMIPLITSDDPKEMLRPIVPPVKLAIKIDDFNKKLKEGFKPLYLALELLDKLDKEMQTTQKEAEKLSELCKANAFAIKQHVK